ncbi:MAG: hypothetical protein KF760_32625 [Candidatus Eremiobacteraeota bacterium]|nr:hypothetical protein [Candidatus Eremiobacteraeota bacterium]MCW5870321.1 hypothetical protein [Candidatus Eremiobacteraeota bacterium]
MRRRGMLLIVALLVLGVALLAGMGLMTSQVSNYRGVHSAEDAALALCLAQAGLEDARLKLERDALFPPHGDGNLVDPDDGAKPQEQSLFTYSEDMFWDAKRIGCYRVSIDSSFAAPYQFVRVTSNGLVGPAEAPTAQRVIKVDLDISTDRPNTTFQPLKVEDLSGL